MAHWLGTNQHLDPRPGGSFQVEVSPGNVARGVYTEIVPFHRVALTWGWDTQEPTLASSGLERCSSNSNWNQGTAGRLCDCGIAVCRTDLDGFMVNAGPSISDSLRLTYPQRLNCDIAIEA
jgi:uncharacterized protein YndB with AHSA1/START domain